MRNVIRKITYLLVTLLWLVPMYALANMDSSTVLTFENFMGIVKKHHPMAQRAELQLIKGDAVLLESRGAFDPKLGTNFSQKYFEDKEYYGLLDGGLKIPTWYGLELNGGYEQNEGVFMNPENNTPGAGLWYAGVSLPLGKGLFIDERRTALRQAKLYRESTLLERQRMYNDLLFTAGKAYWDWFQAYHMRAVYEEAFQLASQRFVATKQSAVLGDRPYIDTLEAGIQVQNRSLNLQQADMKYLNATAMLSVYLWMEGSVPLDVDDNTVPVQLDEVSNRPPPEIFDTLIESHPELQLFQYQLKQLKVDQQWRREQLKPTINLKYNAINEPVNGNPYNGYSPNNYTWGLELGFPIFLRKERGTLRQVDLKLKETNMELTTKRASTYYNVQAAINEWTTTREQVELYTGTVQDYRMLLEGERTMFDAGESSVFMVNSREMGYFNAQLKLVELFAKIGKVDLTSKYSLGQLGRE